MITQGTLAYQVIGSPPDEYTRIWLNDVNRHFFDAFPGKSVRYLDDQTGQYYDMKIFRRKNTEVWITTFELDHTGHRDGVLEAENSFPLKNDGLVIWQGE